MDFLASIPHGEEYPNYLDQLQIEDEGDLETEIKRLSDQISTLRQRLDYFRTIKQVLYFTHFALEHEVVRFFNGELGIRAQHIPGNKEDFRLSSEGGDWCIGEVKGPGQGNVTKYDVMQVAIHRKEAGFTEDFPALVVANNFHQRHNIQQRDEAVHPDVVDRAKEDGILLVRTLDLVRLRTLAASDDEAVGGFTQALRESSGWFEVNKELTPKLHGGPKG
jgi:hypothetical protein